MKSSFKSDYKQHERLSLFIGALKKGMLYNAITFSEYLGKYQPYLKCSSKTIKRDVSTLMNEFSCPLHYDRSLHAYVLLNKSWVLPTVEYNTAVQELLTVDDGQLKSATVRIHIKLRESLLNSLWCRKMKLLDSFNYILTYNLRVSDTQLLKAWIFDQCGNARILGPETLRDEIAQAAQIINEEHTGLLEQEDRGYLPFDEARDYAVALNLASVPQWIAHCESGRKPPDIPVFPDVIYEGAGWLDYDDWLGIITVRKGLKNSLSFTEARKIIRGLCLQTKAQYKTACESGRVPRSISFVPEKFYKEWQGYDDWLGVKFTSS